VIDHTNRHLVHTLTDLIERLRLRYDEHAHGFLLPTNTLTRELMLTELEVRNIPYNTFNE
jgi:hypothetical protein